MNWCRTGSFTTPWQELEAWMSYQTQTKKWAKHIAAGSPRPKKDNFPSPRAQLMTRLANKRKPAGQIMWMSRTWCTIIKRWKVATLSSRRWAITSRSISLIKKKTQIKSMAVVCRPHPRARRPFTDQNLGDSPMKYLKLIGWWIRVYVHRKLKLSSVNDNKLDSKPKGLDLRSHTAKSSELNRSSPL